MILLWDNKGDGAVLSVGSELATLPGANVQQPHLSRKWHTGAGVKASNLIFDMGSAVSCALGALLGTNLTTAATVRWRASTLDPTVIANLLLDTGVVNAGVKAGYGASYKKWNAVTARYWRVDPSDATVPNNLQIGRVVLGPYWSHAGSLLYNWGITPLDDSAVQESYGGQEYPDSRPKRRQLDFTLDYLTESEIYDNPFAMARAAGAVKDVLAIPQEDSTYISEQAVWGLLKAQRPVVHRLSRTFRQQLTVRERL